MGLVDYKTNVISIYYVKVKQPYRRRLPEHSTWLYILHNTLLKVSGSHICLYAYHQLPLLTCKLQEDCVYLLLPQNSVWHIVKSQLNTK